MSSHPDRTSQHSFVFRPEGLPSFDRGGGARTIPLVTASRGATAYLNGITVFDPGARIADHSHNTSESVMVIRGSAVVDIDGERTPLGAFDTTFVPANVPHHFENASETEEMRIFWTYGSTEATRTVMSSGATRRVDAEQAGAGESERCGAVREVAVIEVIPGHESDFEAAVSRAVPLFQRAFGARALSLEASVENPSTYRLTVLWGRLEDHVEGFRESPAFREWRELIGDHIADTPKAEHFRHVLNGF